MAARIRTYFRSNLYSLIAIFVALGGTSYAVAELPKDSIGAKQIEKNAVRSGEIKAGAVRSAEIANGKVKSADVANGSLSGKEITDASLSGLDVQDASIGTVDVANSSLNGGDVQNGTIGTDDVVGLGSDDVSGLTRGDFAPGELPGPVTVQRTDAALPDGSGVAAEVTCPAGQQAISGGASVDPSGTDDIKLLVSRPGNGGLIPADGQEFADTWRVFYRNTAGGTGPATIQAFVLCIPTS